MNFEVIIPILFILLIVLVGILSYNFQKEKIAKMGLFFEELASKLSLDFLPGNTSSFFKFEYPKVLGKINNFGILIHSYTTNGKNKTTYTEILVSTNKPPFYFEIIKETVLQKVAQKLGIKYVKSGIDELDAAYVFRADNEEALKNILDPEITQILLHLSPTILSSIVSKNSVITYNFMGIADTKEKIELLEKVLLVMLKLAKNYPTTK
jgi:hypothetical protein